MPVRIGDGVIVGVFVLLLFAESSNAFSGQTSQSSSGSGYSGQNLSPGSSDASASMSDNSAKSKSQNDGARVVAVAGAAFMGYQAYQYGVLAAGEFSAQNYAGAALHGAMSAAFGITAGYLAYQAIQHEKAQNDAHNFNCQVSGACEANNVDFDNYYSHPDQFLADQTGNQDDANKFKSVMQNLEKQKIKMDPKLQKVVANGKVINSMADAIKAAEGATGHKFSKAELDQLNREIDNLNKRKMSVADKSLHGNKHNGTDDSMLFGGAGSLSLQALLDRLTGKNLKVKMKSLDKPLGFSARSPADVQTKGLSKMFNGEPIGVAGDDIFQIMNRRYLAYDRQNEFLSSKPAPQAP